MRNIRIIPVLLYRDHGLWKGVEFQNHRYLGDPFNAMRVFRLYNVDELVFIDISATVENRTLDPKLIETLASECTMPLCVGGGISSIQQVESLMSAGAEKVIINSHGHVDDTLISTIAGSYGAQAVVGCVETKLENGHHRAYSRNGSLELNEDMVDVAKRMEDQGAGEILLNSIDRDGHGAGYDLEAIAKVADAVSLPIIALGGAYQLEHLLEGARAGASALASGSMFVFYGRRKGILTHYPSAEDLDDLFENERNPVYIDPDLD